MKKIYIIIALISAFAWAAVSCSKASEQNPRDQAFQPVGSEPVTWQDFNTGLKLAKEQKKPVILDFYADWCFWCKKMEAEVFNDAAVAARLKKDFITVRIHTDTNPGETINYKTHVLTKQEFLMMFGVQGLPTVFFLDREGNPITKIPGFVDSKVFNSLLNYVQEGCYEKKIAIQDYMEGKVPCKK